MDGNNRWSKKKKISKLNAYKSGAKNLLKLSKYIFNNYKIKNISAFALSTHNLNRTHNFDKTFISILDIFVLEHESFQIDFKINFIGDLSFIKNQKLIDSIKKIENNFINSKFTLNIFMNYSGRDDIINAAKKFDINYDKKKFNELLSTNILPDPEILIRTGGFKRISDFMLFELSFTDLFFSKKLWPELNIRDIDKYIFQFSKIERKFGI